MAMMLPWIVVLLAVIAMGVLLIMRPAGSAQETASSAGDAGAAVEAGRSGVRGGLTSHAVKTPARRKKDTKLTMRDRLVQAGVYRDNFVLVLRVLRFVLLGLCALGGYMLHEFELMSLGRGLFIGVTMGLAATIIPAISLDYLKSRRQARMRQALPDALDVIVVCLEGGLSLPASFGRVARELADTHPVLAVELRIAEREVQMGLSLGEALRNLAARFDLEELRSLATVVTQADRFGASVSRGFKVFANSMRLRRQQTAEERAHKAAIKLIVPTALFIFPAMFVVALGPAVFRAIDVLAPLFQDVESQMGSPF
jgi:tight adherence protein C